MKTPINSLFAVALFAASLAVAGCASSTAEKSAHAPEIDPKNFKTTIDHPYLPLVPGTVYVMNETEHGQVSVDEVTVTHDTKTILGVQCVVVHDVLTRDGKVVEDTLDWFAQDLTGNVWYFGEATKEFKSNGEADTEGSWEAGVAGARPGIAMPAKLDPGWPYRQEYLKGVAEDWGQITGTGETVKVPAGEYHVCVRTREWTPLSSGHESKWYAKGVGLVRSESTGGEVAELVSVKNP